MGKNKELSEADRMAIKTLADSSKTERQIAKQLNKPKSTVHDALTRLKNHNSLKSLPRIGRPRKTNSRLDRKIERMASISDNPNAVDIAKQLESMSLASICPQTVRNRLYEFNLHGRVVAKKPLLIKRHITQRLNFAKKYQNWTVEDWKRVLWSDETKINLHGSDGRLWTWKKPNEPLQKKHVKQTIKHDKYIMVWGCFSWSGVGKIKVLEDTLTSNKYVRVLSECMLTSGASLIGENFIFQQDNDPKHTAKNTKEWLASKNIEVLEWPAQSPDLNPIEILWHLVKVEIGKLNLKNINELRGGP